MGIKMITLTQGDQTVSDHLFDGGSFIIRRSLQLYLRLPFT